MPLIKCPACEKDISAQASSCPNCGHPLAKSDANKPQSKSRLGWLVLKGSHGTLHYGSHKTTLKDLRKEIGTGLLHDMLAQLGLSRHGLDE
jgi:predicted amidophosphoribosyltransferase